MTKLNVFEHIKWGCKTHPADVKYIIHHKKYGIYDENCNPDAQYDTMRELVEGQGCSWEWYCEYYDLNVDDECFGNW